LNTLNLRTPGDTFLYHALVTHLRQKPDTYVHIRTFYKDSQASVLRMLQNMLDAGEITASNLDDGVITDRSVISLTES
jgi:hypothetical protein